MNAGFIAPMLLVRTDALPEGEQWAYELKLDGYRAIAFKSKGRVYLRSRNNNDFAERYPAILPGLAKLPDDTVIDGELVAFDSSGKPSFNALQNTGSSPASVQFFVFDVIVLAGVSLMSKPLHMRIDALKKKVLPKLREPVRFAARSTRRCVI